MDGFFMSGPEEGDVCDQSVFVCNDLGDELFEITAEGSVEERRELGRQLAELMNKAKVKI
jgi:hypothetical protein